MSGRDAKLEDLNRDRVGHEGRELTTDQAVRIEHTDDSVSADGGSLRRASRV
jgi:hypothetical protein